MIHNLFKPTYPRVYLTDPDRSRTGPDRSIFGGQSGPVLGA